MTNTVTYSAEQAARYPSPTGERAGYCPWTKDDAKQMRYHDEEWGVPVTDSKALFNKYMLDAFQAGLSWRTVLYKRESLNAAFANFDPCILAQWSQQDVQRALNMPNIIRNRAKARAAVTNAIAWQKLERGEGFATFLWKQVNFTALQPYADRLEQVPIRDDLTISISKQLKKLGFSFCGPTMVMALMEAVGMRNHHLTSCPMHQKCLNLADAAKDLAKKQGNEG